MPESISSKIKTGISSFCASTDLSASITRETSPPEAIFASGFKSSPGLGEIKNSAETVGRKLKNLARSHQILCITHLQQIASFADSHFKVEKKVKEEQTKTIIRPLDRDEKIEEIARMISGQKITPQAHKQASLMLEQSQA